MEVILLERLGRLGGIGDVVAVRDGYARNFLIPQKKALRATDANKKVFELRREQIEAENAQAIAEAQVVAEKIKNVSLTIVRQASQEGKLYGSVTVRDVADALLEAGHEVAKSQIVLSTTIRTTGEHEVRVNLHAEVIVKLQLNVVRVESEAA